MTTQNKSRLIASAKPSDNKVIVSVRVRGVHPGVYYHNTSWTQFNLTEGEFSQLVWREIRSKYDYYVNTTLDYTFSHIYGKPLKFNNKAQVLNKMRTIEETMGKSILDMSKEIRQYMGYPCSFWRKQNDKLTILASEKIVAAYKMVQDRRKFVDIENFLYF